MSAFLCASPTSSHIGVARLPVGLLVGPARQGDGHDHDEPSAEHPGYRRPSAGPAERRAPSTARTHRLSGAHARPRPVRHAPQVGVRDRGRRRQRLPRHDQRDGLGPARRLQGGPDGPGRRCPATLRKRGLTLLPTRSDDSARRAVGRHHAAEPHAGRHRAQRHRGRRDGHQVHATFDRTPRDHLVPGSVSRRVDDHGDARGRAQRDLPRHAPALLRVRPRAVPEPVSNAVPRSQGPAARATRRSTTCATTSCSTRSIPTRWPGSSSSRSWAPAAC